MGFALLVGPLAVLCLVAFAVLRGWLVPRRRYPVAPRQYFSRVPSVQPSPSMFTQTARQVVAEQLAETQVRIAMQLPTHPWYPPFALRDAQDRGVLQVSDLLTDADLVWLDRQLAPVEMVAWRAERVERERLLRA